MVAGNSDNYVHVGRLDSSVKNRIHGGREGDRFEPVIRSPAVRLVTGVVLVSAGSYFAASYGALPFLTIFFPLVIGWALSTWLTDKYKHKYPQRYYSYLLASHGKAAVIFAFIVILFGLFSPFDGGAVVSLRVAILFLATDFLLSVPRSRISENSVALAPSGMVVSPVPGQPKPVAAVNGSEIRRQLTKIADVACIKELSLLIGECMQEGDSGAATTRVVEVDLLENGDTSPVAFLLQKKSLISVKRLNLFLQGLPGAVLMGGYFVFRYKPMDDYLEELRSKKKGLALRLSYVWHFLRHRALPKIPVFEKLYFSKYLSGLDSLVYRHTGENRRVISRAEMWGRMYFWGFEVLEESKIGDDHWVVTRRFRDPEMTRKPSFFMVARLTKVGLGGQPMHLHKLRTMYPFSEFVQEKIYKDHGLSNTGKFKNDFRLTDYGRFLRRFWLDEIPQIFDWLRGEIKLVGMRATSPHFLSLYPKELYDLYVQTKPGLIPPIFDANTTGFDDIVRIELAYLNAYQRRPVMTDVKCFFKTFHDIFFRGVRSK